MRRILVIVMLVFLSSCIMNSDNPYDNLDYRVGTEGLVVEFDRGLPVKAYEDTYLNLVLELRNKGADELVQGDAFVYLSGFDPNAIWFRGYDNTNGYVKKDVLTMMGKNPYSMEGGYEILEFEETNTLKVPFGDTYTPTLMATTCYKYQTLAAPTVCVVSNPNDILKDDVCKPDTITMSSQGAPVAVTKVEEEVMQQMLNFIITIENVGDGRIVALESMSNCPFQLKHNDMNYVNVDVKMSGGGTPICTPGNKIRIVDGKGVVFCKIPVEIETSYTTQLEIVLEYGYSSSTTQTIEIARPPGSSPTGSSTTVNNPGTNPSTSTPPSTTNPPSTTTQPTNDKSICPCGLSTNMPCVCLYVDDMRMDCGSGSPTGYGPVYVTPGQHTLRVDGSSTALDGCKISGETRIGRCPNEVSRSFTASTTISVYAYTAGVQKASQNCNIIVSSSGD